MYRLRPSDLDRTQRQSSDQFDWFAMTPDDHPRRRPHPQQRSRRQRHAVPLHPRAEPLSCRSQNRRRSPFVAGTRTTRTLRLMRVGWVSLRAFGRMKNGPRRQVAEFAVGAFCEPPTAGRAANATATNRNIRGHATGVAPSPPHGARSYPSAAGHLSFIFILSGSDSRPSRLARARASWARLWTPSLRYARPRCASTVLGLRIHPRSRLADRRTLVPAGARTCSSRG